MKAVDGLLVELVLEHERVELGGLDLAALLRLGGERVQCGNLDDAGLQVSSFRSRARGADGPARCGVCLRWDAAAAVLSPSRRGVLLRV